jgi:pSer/pThr/pTyr-binding forkhead associated (FHA) protein
MSRQTTATPSLLLTNATRHLRCILLDKPRLGIGRRAFNDIVLDDLTVSGEHAVLFNQSGVTLITDLGSRNGTRVNGLGITRRILIDGDRIDVGVYTLTYVDDRPASLPMSIPLPSNVKVLSGQRAGQSIALDGTLQSLRGDAGDLAVLTARCHAYHLTHLDGTACPLVNGEPIGLGARQLEDQDIIELGGTLFQFVTDPVPKV